MFTYRSDGQHEGGGPEQLVAGPAAVRRPRLLPQHLLLSCGPPEERGRITASLL